MAASTDGFVAAGRMPSSSDVAAVVVTGEGRGAVAAEFAEFVDAHHARLARLAFLICGDREQAEDAVAEAYAKVWPRYQRGTVDDLVPYVKRAVVNQVRGGLRRRVVERREQERRRVDWRDGTSLERRIDVGDVVAHALAELPIDQRTVLVLRYFEDLSEEETAAVLGVKRGTVKSRAARGLARVRESIELDPG